MNSVYDQYAASAVFSHHTEEEFFTLAKRYFKARYLPLISKDKTAPILDMGCGQGRFVKLLQEEGYVAIRGIDLSQDQIAYGKEKLDLSCIECTDACSFLSKAEPNTYATILMLDVLEHLDLDTSLEALRLAYRALQAGGAVVIQVPNGLAPLTPQLFGDITHHRCYTSCSMKQSLLLAGFSKTAMYSQPPIVHGVKSCVRRILWDLCVNPLIGLYMLIACGTSMGGIYTPNLLAVAKK